MNALRHKQMRRDGNYQTFLQCLKMALNEMKRKVYRQVNPVGMDGRGYGQLDSQYHEF